MLQNKAYKKRLLMVNVSITGDKERLKSGTAGHPMMRITPASALGSTDKLRGILGQYHTTYKSSRGTTLVNYSTIIDRINAGNTPGHHEAPGAPDRLNPPQLRLQLESPNGPANIVLTTNLNDPNLTRDQLYSPTFQVQAVRSWAWNGYQDKDDAYETYIGGAGTTTRENFVSYINSLSSSAAVTHKDYTAVFYPLVRDKAIRAASGMMLTVKGEYNYYANTTPSYETATAFSNVREGMLPNAYIMYSELQNTGSLLLANYHQRALSIPGDGPGYFMDSRQTQGGVTERNTVGAYQLWATGLSRADVEDNLDTMATNNTNFVILHSDEAITNSEYIRNEMIPYCVELVIPPDDDQFTGLKSGASFLRNMANDKDTKSFIDILQAAAINNHLNWPAPASTFERFTSTTKFPLDADDASRYEFTTETTAIPILCDVGASLAEYMDAVDSPDISMVDDTTFGRALNTINDYYTNYDNSSLPYRFLKDYARSGFNPNPDKRIQDSMEHIENAQVDLSASLQSWSRTYTEILAGAECHTETLMYVVSKYLLNDDGTQPDGALPVQTFYISNKLGYENLGYNESIPITFYDSQVKYEKKYRYVFHKMVLIVGNEYKYTDETKWWDYLGPTTYKKLKVHNTPNIKIVMVPYLAEGLDCLVVDKPPVPPEMSFYLHKGISNKIQILLNSNTGKYDLAPISILPTDPAFFEKEYLAQQEEALSFEEIKNQKKKISFNSDDPVDAYQLFRLQKPPEGYGSFTEAMVNSPSLNPVYGTGASYVDTIVPNTKYYYCARSIDIHANISNPTTIIEIEVVDDDGKIYLKQKPYTFKTVKQRLIKPGRRFILIEPTSQQTSYNQENPQPDISVNSTPTERLGAAGLLDSVWGKEFKIRLTSKQTGRKMDLNINFNNSGIVKGSE